MKLSDKAIKEIAENLDCGMVCFVHKETKEIKPMLDMDRDMYEEPELWKADLDEIENNRDKYVKLEKMSSNEGFQIMVDFLDEVSNEGIRERLRYALEKNKPFRNFKYEVDYNEEIRQQWFKFKAYKYEEWVKDCLEDIEDGMEEEDTELDFLKGGRYFDDDGKQYNPDLYPIPNLCISCKKKDDPREEVLCNLTRLDQLGEAEFKCFAYLQK